MQYKGAPKGEGVAGTTAVVTTEKKERLPVSQTSLENSCLKDGNHFFKTDENKLQLIHF